MKIDATTTFCLAADCLATHVDDEMILMSLKGGVYLGLDRMASKIAERLSSPVSFGDLVLGLRRDFDAPPQVIEDETREFLQQLLHHQVIETRG
ncbi:coenzyme PQQ synthesis protein D PqqD [mine drainage metagenome]|uniref:Coenzyme PQQ synthesis protein D PqqD n=1 Tax=mine drainage metagenome TaxID=410659 RepID=A0A1J5RZ37_9ZZZZ